MATHPERLWAARDKGLWHWVRLDWTQWQDRVGTRCGVEFVCTEKRVYGEPNVGLIGGYQWTCQRCWKAWEKAEAAKPKAKKIATPKQPKAKPVEYDPFEGDLL